MLAQMNIIQRDKKEVVELPLNDGSMIVINRYHEGDLPFIYEIEKLCFSPSERYTEQHLEMLGQFQSYCFLVAQENTESTIVGYCIGVIKPTREGPVGHIISIAVHPDHRRRGIGVTLVKELMRQLKDAGASYFRLEVKTTNMAARKMYRKLGFNYQYILRNYYGNENDAIVMTMRP
jgi:ribosomal-protein-alanine N-acetyltransferase